MREDSMEGQYVVAVTYDDGSVYHYGPFASDEAAESFAGGEREEDADCDAVVHVLHGVLSFPA
jgi:hypothetical protein